MVSFGDLEARREYVPPGSFSSLDSVLMVGLNGVVACGGLMRASILVIGSSEELVLGCVMIWALVEPGEGLCRGGGETGAADQGRKLRA